MAKTLIFLAVILAVIHLKLSDAKALSNIRSDSIETKFGNEDEIDQDLDVKKPGWIRRNLLRFGNIASRMGNNLGGTAFKVTNVIEKLCKMLKTVIPIVAAVCTVGQFQFCSSADAPVELAAAMNQNPINLDVPDR